MSRPPRVRVRSVVLLIGLLLGGTSPTALGQAHGQTSGQTPSQTRGTQTQGSQTHEAWSYNRAMYEVNVRQYTEAGTFAAFDAHLDRLADLGVGVLWFMPIHPIGQENRLGSLGSPYAVRDYTAINPEFGTLDDFKATVRKAHDRGLRVLIDWVANHTAWDHPLTQTHPGWYVTDEDGDFTPPPGTNWSDVIQLDHSQPGLRQYMIDAMTFWVEEVGVDGFRFDAASFVPRDFWQAVLPAVRAARPDLLFLAEADSPAWHAAGFDQTYGWGLYGFEGGVLQRIADGRASALSLGAYLDSVERTYPEDAYRLYFTSNHDENAWHGTPAERFGDAAEVFAVLTATIEGMPLLYGGQEAGLDRRLAFFDKDQIVWREHPNRALYTALIQEKRRNEALWNGTHGGDLVWLETDAPFDATAFSRTKNGDRALVVANLSDAPRTVTVTGAIAGTYAHLFSDASTTLDTTAAFTLDAWDYAVYTQQDVATSTGTVPTPSALTLAPVFPNPAAGRATISFTLPEARDVEVRVVDALGRTVRRLDAGVRPAGIHTLPLDTAGLPSGVYVGRLTAGAEVATQRFTVAR